MTVRPRPGVYLCHELRLAHHQPHPLWIGDQDAARKFFRKLLADGFELAPTSGNGATLACDGVPRRMVWVEDEHGRALCQWQRRQMDASDCGAGARRQWRRWSAYVGLWPRYLGCGPQTLSARLIRLDDAWACDRQGRRLRPYRQAGGCYGIRAAPARVGPVRSCFSVAIQVLCQNELSLWIIIASELRRAGDEWTHLCQQFRP